MALKFNILVDDEGSAKIVGLGKKIKKVGKQTSTFGDTFKAVFGAQVLLGGLAKATQAIKGLVSSFDEVAKAGDQFDKMSKKTGVAVEFLSEFGHVANLAGSDINQVGGGLKRLARNLSDAQNGLMTAKRAFMDIGLEVQNADGSLKKVDDVILSVADRFANMTDNTKKAALAQELFGRAGADLVPLLNQGSDAIRVQMQEAKDLGIAWDTLSATQAAEFVDAMTKMKGVMDGIKRSTFLPLMVKLTPVMEGLGKKIDFAKEAMRILGRFFVRFVNLDTSNLNETQAIILLIGETAAEVGKGIVLLTSTFKHLILTAKLIKNMFTFDFGGFNNTMNEVAENIDNASTAMADLDKVTASFKKNVQEDLFDDIKGSTLNNDSGGGSDPAIPDPSIQANLQRTIDALKLEAMGEGIEKEKTLLNTWGLAQLQIIGNNEEGRTVLRQVGKARRFAIEKKHFDDVKRLRDLETKMEYAHSAAVLSTTATMIGAIGNLAEAMGASAKEMAGIRIVETAINTGAAIMKIMAQGGLFAIPLAIAAGIQGAAQVAMITQQASKLADGGVISGNGGGRSDNVPAMLSVGERVLSNRDIARLGGNDRIQQAIDSTGGKSTSSININTMIGDKEWVRDNIIPQLEMESTR